MSVPEFWRDEEESMAVESDLLPRTGDPGLDPGLEVGGVPDGLPFLDDDQGAATAAPVV